MNRREWEHVNSAGGDENTHMNHCVNSLETLCCVVPH